MSRRRGRTARALWAWASNSVADHLMAVDAEGGVSSASSHPAVEIMAPDASLGVEQAVVLDDELSFIGQTYGAASALLALWMSLAARGR